METEHLKPGGPGLAWLFLRLEGLPPLLFAYTQGAQGGVLLGALMVTAAPCLSFSICGW